MKTPVVLSLILLLTASSLPVMAQPAPVRINELAWAGSSSHGSSDEWIELYNPTSNEVDLSGWSLTKLSSGSEKLMLTLPDATHIPAQGYFLISHFDKDLSDLDVSADLISSSLTLSNTTLQIKLYDAVFPAGNLVDTAGSGGVPETGSNTTPKATMERATSGWQTATEHTNLDSASADLGTPKAPNTTTSPPPPPEDNPDDDDPEDETVVNDSPSAPIAKVVMLFADEVGGDTVTLSWEIRNFAAKSYRLWQSTSGSLKGTKLKEFKPTEKSFQVKGLDPGSYYYFFIETVGTQGESVESNKLLAQTIWPADLIVINEIWPHSFETLSPYIELATKFNRDYFTGWKVKAGTKQIEIQPQLSAQQTTSLLVFGLPNDFLTGEVNLELLTPTNKLVTSLAVPSLAKDSGYVLGYDGKYHLTTQATPGSKNQIVSQEMLEAVAGDTDPMLPPAGNLGLWLAAISMILSVSGLIALGRKP